MLSTLNPEIMRAIQADRIREAERARRAQAFRKSRAEKRVALAEELATPEPPSTPALGTLPGLAHSASAVKVGPFVEVGATVATDAGGRVLFPGDPYLQAREALRAVGESLTQAGAGLRDVVRTRVFLKKSWQWEEVGRAHGEFFGDVRPVTTFVGAGGFVDSDILVAIEATALLAS